MNKYLSIALLFLIFHIPQTTEAQYEWGNWTAWDKNSCYGGVYYRVQVRKLNTNTSPFNEVRVEIQHVYGQKIHLTWDYVKDGGIANGTDIKRNFEKGNIVTKKWFFDVRFEDVKFTNLEIGDNYYGAESVPCVGDQPLSTQPNGSGNNYGNNNNGGTNGGNSNPTWSDWKSFNCYQGIQFREKYGAVVNGHRRSEFQFKNNYPYRIQFDTELATDRGNAPMGHFNLGTSDTETQVFSVPTDREIHHINVSKVREGLDTDGTYRPCDNERDAWKNNQNSQMELSERRSRVSKLIKVVKNQRLQAWYQQAYETLQEAISLSDGLPEFDHDIDWLKSDLERRLKIDPNSQAAASNSFSMKQLVDQGEEFYQNGNIDAAEKKFKEASALYINKDYRQRTKEMDGLYQHSEIRRGNINKVRRDGGKIPGTNNYYSNERSATNYGSYGSTSRTIERKPELTSQQVRDDYFNKIEEDKRITNHYQSKSDEIFQQRLAIGEKIRAITSSDWKATDPTDLIREYENKSRQMHSNYEQEINLIGNQHKVGEQRIQAHKQTLEGKNAAEYEAVSTGINALGTLLRAHEAKKDQKWEQEMLAKKMNRKMWDYKKEMLAGFKETVETAMKKAAYVPSVEEEQYLIKIHAYSTCAIKSIEANFDENSAEWIRLPNCSKPSEPYISPIPPSNRDIAVRKYKLYKEKELRVFKKAASDYMNLAISEEPQNPLNYEYYAKHMSETTLEKIKYLLTAQKLSGHSSKYNTAVRNAKIELTDELKKALTTGDQAKARKIFMSKLYNPLSIAKIEGILKECVKGDQYITLKVCESYFSNATSFIKNNAGFFKKSIFENDAIACYTNFTKRKLFLADSQKDILVAIENKGNKIVKHLLENEENNFAIGIFGELKSQDKKAEQTFLANSLLDLGIEKDDLKAMNIAMNNGASVIGDKDEKGNTLLNRFLLDGDTKKVSLLLKNKRMRKHIHKVNKKGWQAIHLAAWKGDLTNLDRLLAMGADVNAKGENGWTAMHYAVKEKQLTVVKKLLQYRAATKIKDDSGLTPIQIAKRMRLKTIKKVLS